MAKKEKLGKLCKEHMVNEIVSRFEEKPNFVITSYMGTSVSDLELLRRNLKKADASYLVVKNSILKVVFDKLKISGESSSIESGMGISFGGADMISACKVLVTFAKDHNKFKIKGAVIDGQSFGMDKVNRLATLPSKEILLAQVVGGIKSPITGFVMTLGAIIRKFVCVVDAVKTSKEKSGAAAAGAPETKT